LFACHVASAHWPIVAKLGWIALEQVTFDSQTLMKAVVLAAGKGTRMRELTNELPKPMLNVHGKPILEHILQGIRDAGVREFCIVTGYRAEMVEAHFGQGARWDAKIVYARQEVQDGTGKAPELAKSFVGDDAFVLTYGDILVKPSTYQRMISRFHERKFDGLVTVTRGQDVTKGAINFFDDQFCLQRIVEKPSPAQVEQFRATGRIKPGGAVWYNAGIYVFRPVLFPFTAQLHKSPRGEYELPDAINAMVEAGHLVAGLEIEGRWIDVRDPEVLRDLEAEKI
jgi:UDP-N-acetylglucosamine diphosphorylase / glucose-1-phosphate thymidylyltransferase / UDP-N-acetylgalactosamine diphosphorylase / glucosamine-1-phosphate N-acetyltransferase / galactosamine-1-phosphate N-acetyltransferase